MKDKIIHVRDIDVGISTFNENDYICLTDWLRQNQMIPGQRM